MKPAGNLEIEPILSVRDLHTYFVQDEGTVKAVDGVSFDVRKGQVLGVVGESGCGKSITVRSVLRLIEPPGRIVRGEILYRQNQGQPDERLIDIMRLKPNSSQMREIRGKEIALIFQEPMTSFSPVHSIGSQIVEAVRLHTDLPKKERWRLGVETLKQVGVPNAERRMHEYPHQLSGGLRQRAMIAMALICRPKILIADEPTTAIDVTTQALVLDLLVRLQRELEMAMIFITHNLGVIAEIADEVIVMYMGRVVEQAPIDDLFHDPQHPYTKALVKSIPSIHSTPREKLATIKGSIPHPFRRPQGCPFHTRCDQAMVGVCDIKSPQLRALNGRRAVSCFLYHEDQESGDLSGSMTKGVD
jgi:peptide/nickel transport system ATP-binding protein